uniref:Putative conserved plasma membrane protein n=1 Tax=Ixodes ricinus TaxID=34613 RepID=A0A131XS39_IXORI
MAYLTHCCCGCMTVRTGTKVLAILSVIDALIGIIIYSTLAVYQKEVAEVFDDLPAIKSSLEFNVGEFIAYIVLGVIGVIVSSLCIRGAYTDQRYYILPYLVFDFMVLVVQAILVIWLIVVVIANGALQILLVACFRVLWLCLWCYFYVVVLSFYKQLANAANNAGIGMVPAVYPGTYVPPRSYSPAAPDLQCYTDSKMALV